ncbi:hypothetical protein [Prosthecobacter sp.]|uniref:hypothetical protein n=1 Tax=Prosthecobacter sp. TaxID=1965333 RepID=UPI001DCF5F08|nr:hypothetical protein [Prosthecobacter sp.]MCB1277677.1 hypothetical protein [Prosthecobacter sp.]
MQPLHLIDAIGPFFRGHDVRTINWSKIPWQNVPKTRDAESDAWWAQVRTDLTKFADQAAAWGFNAVSFDDVTHLADHPWLEAELRERIALYREEFARCFAIFTERGLQVHLTMDVMTVTPELRRRMSESKREVNDYLAELLDGFFSSFPQVAGIIVRIGEADGKGVHDEFRSELVIRKPAQARRLLLDLLPVCEKHARRLIFRTWTVGAYRIGDLMWHRGTFTSVFEGLQSKALVISMKYGESDFFRYLPLNSNFFRTDVAKIVELQTRREYEGCGEYPSFTGWEYERYAHELKHAKNVVGCMVWCQTGGWVPFRRIALIDPEAIWIDLNTFVTLRIMKDGMPVEEAVRAFVKERALGDAEALIELLRYSDEVIHELLYVQEFAQQKLFFRRVRIPPLLQVYWGNIFINHSVKKLLRYFVREPEAALHSAARCMSRLEQMITLAPRAGVPVADLQYMHDTFHLLALAREYCFTEFTPEMETRLREAKRAYKAKYPKRGLRARYRIKMGFKPFWVQRRYLGWAVELFMRRRRGYRIIDRLLILHVLSMIYRVIALRKPHWIPGFAKESAMGVDVVFR